MHLGKIVKFSGMEP